jgi:hypothetical protein
MKADGRRSPTSRVAQWPWGTLLPTVLTLPLAGLIASRVDGLVGRGLAPLTDRAAALTATCLLLVPLVLNQRARQSVGLLLIALAGGLAALALPFLLGRPDPGVDQLLAGTFMVAALTFLIAAMARLLLPLAGDPSSALGWVLVAALVLAAAPLWLAEPLDQGAPIANLLIAVNPLTALGLCGSIDYPRHDWFYRHSPLGGLRYVYPSPLFLFLSYLLAGIAALALTQRAEGRVARMATRPDPTLANPSEMTS